LHNEQPALIPGCPDIYCPFDTFKSIMSRYYNCDFNDVCGIIEAPNEKCEPSKFENEYVFEVFHVLVTFIVGLILGMLIQKFLTSTLYSASVKAKEE